MKDGEGLNQLTSRIEELEQRIRKLENLVSEGEKAKESLREREIYLKTIFSAIQTGIMVIDAESQEIIDLNDVAEKLIGASKKEIVDHTCHKYVCPAEKGKCPILDLKQRVDHSERILLNKDGEEIAIIKNVVPVILNGRKCLIESFIDISERKIAEKALEESREKYRSIVEKFLKMSNEILIEVSKN